jgi:hypothetical protein
MSAPRAPYEGEYFPTPPTIVVETQPNVSLETERASDDTTQVDDCDQRRRRRSKRRRRREHSKDIVRHELEANCHLDGHWVCTIDRAELLRLLEDPTTMARQARVVPSKKDGQIVGLKFYGIRTGSLPKALHLQNGDLLVSIDGIPATDLQELVEHFSGLKAEIEHGPLSIDYHVVRKGVELEQTLRIE